MEYKDFHKENEIGNDTIKKYSEILPNELISVWKKYGVGSVMGGFLRFINPDEYIDILRESFSDHEGVVPVIVTAFGDIITINGEGRIDIIYYRYGYYSVIASNWEMFEIFVGDSFMSERMFKNNLYNDAIEKHGEVGFEECFGYVPLLALGGSEKVTNIKIVKIKEHIELITELVGILSEMKSIVM
jgi:hypothetical protein